MLRLVPLAVAACLLAAPALLHATEDVAVTLSGSRASMLRQNRVAKTLDYSFLRTPAQVLRYTEHGRLVELPGGADYAVIAGYPFARPVVRSFIERLAAGYHAGCGEKLVVTSLTRPSTRQPPNASPLSVHPAGMAVDLRYSARAACRAWLGAELLRLEELGLIDATLEHRPPHFHVAVFPPAYEAWEHALAADSVLTEATRLLEEAAAARDAELVRLDETAAAADGAADRPRAVALLRLARWVTKLVLPASAPV
jgi:hypothetical protein